MLSLFPIMLTLFLQFLIPSARAATVSSTPAQTFTGIGGSGAWWPMDLYNFPEATRQNLSDLLFSSSGLGLSSYRWNVGSGGVNVSNPVRAPETFYVAPGQYDWDKDKQGVYFLKAASDRGVKDLTMFANSAPAPLTQDRTSCNSYFVNGDSSFRILEFELKYLCVHRKRSSIRQILGRCCRAFHRRRNLNQLHISHE